MLWSDLEDESFGWMAEGIPGSAPAYLKLLNPHLCDETRPVFANLWAVADRLRDRPEHWSRLIRSDNWHFNLIGCSAVLISREEKFLDDLRRSFRMVSFVSPQLAVAIGLVHREIAEAEFPALLREPISDHQSKRVFSAYAVLKILGHESAEEFESGDRFRRFRDEPVRSSALAYDGDISVRVVRHHWDFWTGPVLDSRPNGR